MEAIRRGGWGVLKELDFIQQQWRSLKGSDSGDSAVTLQLLNTSLCVSSLGAAN